jgi:hypothetical protein
VWQSSQQQCKGDQVLYSRNQQCPALQQVPGLPHSLNQPTHIAFSGLSLCAGCLLLEGCCGQPCLCHLPPAGLQVQLYRPFLPPPPPCLYPTKTPLPSNTPPLSCTFRRCPPPTPSNTPTPTLTVTHFASAACCYKSIAVSCACPTSRLLACRSSCTACT